METFSATTRDGLALQGTWNLPDGLPRATVVHVHGFGEHHRRHDRMAAALAAADHAVVRFDLRGHGLSGGRRGDFNIYDSLLDDVDVIREVAGQRFPDVPRILYGHSFGGGIVANWLLRRRRNDVAAAVLSSPWFRLRRQPGWLQQFAARAAAPLFPTFRISTGIRAEDLASNSESMRQYRGDPLVIKKITLRAVLAAIDAGEFALQHAAEWKVPTLVMHGTGDRITSFSASEQFAKAAPGVELKLFDGLAHEMHFEDRAEEVIAVATQWLAAQVSPSW